MQRQRKRLRIPALLIGLTTIWVGAPAAQETLHETLGEFVYLGHGFALAVAGDVNADGIEDYWASAPDPWDAGIGVPGNVRLFSGSDGSVIHTLDGVEWGARFGHALASGCDVTGDAVADVAIGTPRGMGTVAQTGHVSVRNGATMAEVYGLSGLATGDRFGEALCFIDDRNGDGVHDLLIGAPGDDIGGVDAGSVRIVSGVDGATLDTLHGATGSAFGSSIADVGDLDGDGKRELFIGAAQGGALGEGAAFLYDGDGLGLLACFDGDVVGDRFGHSVAAAGDVNGDLVTDLVVGAPGGDYARVFSGLDGTLLWTASYATFELESYAPSWVENGFGAAVTSAGDQDGDGRADVAVGYPGHSSLRLYSGADGSLLEFVTSAHQISNISADILSVYFGHALVSVDDRNGDGRRELAVGAPFDFERASGGVGTDYDVGGVAIVAVDTDPRWVREVRSIAGAGDIDGDGHDDVALGYPSEIEIVSGRTGAVLRTISGVPTTVMKRAGDVNQDGIVDLIVGSRGHMSNRGTAVVLSGADGSTLFTKVGDNPGDLFGTSVSGVGDLDGDGYGDFAAGAPLSNNPSGIGGGCYLDAGYVRVFSGQTGAVLLDLQGEGLPTWNCDWGPWSEAFGFSLTGCGDWNLDGVPDLAVGAPGAGLTISGEVRVFSGVDGSILDEFSGSSGGEFGISVDGGAHFDVNADGRRDLVIGEQIMAYGPHQTVGYAHLVSSADGGSLGTFSVPPPQFGYSNSIGPAYSVAALRDFDLDGHSDFVIGNPTLPGLLGPGVGEVRIVSGRTGGLLAKLEGNSSWDYFGYSVVNAGDVNGDGASDVLGLALPSFAPNTYPRATVLHGVPRRSKRFTEQQRPSR